jgi:hypothetical protein
MEVIPVVLPAENFRVLSISSSVILLLPDWENNDRAETAKSKERSDLIVVVILMWDVGFEMWDVGCGMWDVGCGMWDVGCGM